MRKTSAGVVQYSGPRGVTGRINAASYGQVSNHEVSENGRSPQCTAPVALKGDGRDQT